MPALSPLTIGFVLLNAIFGVIIGALTARAPAFNALGVPSFLWLVAGLFAFEMAAGVALKANPSSLIAMPVRVSGLVMSFICCYATLAFMT